MRLIAEIVRKVRELDIFCVNQKQNSSVSDSSELLCAPIGGGHAPILLMDNDNKTSSGSFKRKHSPEVPGKENVIASLTDTPRPPIRTKRQKLASRAPPPKV